MVLISVQSVETNNGYQFKNDFAESIIIDPKSRVSLINANLSRNIDYVILDGGNQFEMVVGGANNPKDIIGIPSGTYDANGLSQEIETSLNSHYANSGHSFNVNYLKKANLFNLQHIFRTNTLTTNECVDWVIGATTDAPNITLFKHPIELKLHNMTNGTAEYAISTNAIIATQNVPDFVDGGSVFQVKAHFPSGDFPQTGGAGSSFGWGFGMYSKQLGTKPTTGVKQVSINANLNWLDIGIVFFKETTGDTQFKIMENGVNIYGGVASRGFTPHNGDEYRIVLSQSSTNDGRPRYQYKKHGQSDFTDFPIGAGLQTIRTADWRNQALYSAVFSDTEGSNGNAVLRELNYSAKGSNELVASEITALENGQRLLEGKLTRTNYNNGVEGGGDNQGILTQLLGADQTSLFQFVLPSASNKLFHIALCDEETRLTNNDTDPLNVGQDTLYGTTSQPNGTKLTTKSNTSFGSVLFDTTNNKIYKRNALNKHCDYEPLSGVSPNAIIAPPLEEITAQRNFTTAKWTTTTKFYALCVGNDNAMKLTASPSGDREKGADEILVAIINNPESDFTGIQTATITNKGTGYTNSTEFTCRLGALTGGGGTAGVGAIVKYTTDGSGEFDNGAGSADVCSGKGYSINQIYTIIPIDPTTGADLTGDDAGDANATITITELTLATDRFNEAMGSSYSASKTNNGYRWNAVVRDWEGDATKAQTPIGGIALSVEESTEHTPYVEFYPQYEANFGNILGFPQAQYIITGDNVLVAPDHPLPDLALPLNPSLHINIPNLPIKSYVGMKLKQDASLGDKPVGNIQGLTKQVAKIPRYHDSNLVSSSGLEGPFYYDYFPYDVPLHNATELVLNELDIEITNPDGTLAKDIGSAHLLLNITNVESVGEGQMNGGIGMPKKMYQSHQQLNNNPAMLQPSIYGGKSYGGTHTEHEGKLMTATHGTPI